MSNMSTFGAFTAARLGIYASQKALNVAGHNISNINTRGFTRQRLDQMSLRLGGGEKYYSQYDANTGSGVLCTGVSQLRDPYLDIRFRNENSSVGAMDTKLSGLDEISSILDEVAKGNGSGALEAQFNDLMKQIGSLSDKAGQTEYDTLVRSSAEALTELLKYYSKQLDTVEKGQDGRFRQDVQTVNSILKNIGTLNSSIQKSQIHGDGALELRDQRNMLLDQLSGFMKVNVEYQDVNVGAGDSAEKMVIKTAGPPQYTLVDGNYVSQVSIKQLPTQNPATTGPNDLYIKPDGTFTGDPALAKQVDSPNYDLVFDKLTNAKDATWGEKKVTNKSYGTDQQAAADALALLVPGFTDKNGVRTTLSYALTNKTDKNGVTTYAIETTEQRSTQTVEVGDNHLYGGLQSAREILTEEGEFSTQDTVDNVDESAATKRGVRYYQKSLDALAQKLASVLNEGNTGYLHDKSGNYVDAAGKAITYIDGGVTKNLTKDTTLDAALTTLLKNTGVAMGGPLFSNDSRGNDTSGITAANISIAKDWTLGNVRIVNSFVMGENGGVGPNSTDTTNILHLMSLIQSDQNYKASDIVADAAGGTNSVFFKGSFQEMLSNTCAQLANDVKTTNTLLNNYAAAATELDVSRDSVSGVDLNDEAANLMQYQKSYAAACRLMTTLDEALDKLINGTGMVGR